MESISGSLIQGADLQVASSIASSDGSGLPNLSGEDRLVEEFASFFIDSELIDLVLEDDA